MSATQKPHYQTQRLATLDAKVAQLKKRCMVAERAVKLLGRAIREVTVAIDQYNLPATAAGAMGIDVTKTASVVDLEKGTEEDKAEAKGDA